MRTVFGHSSPSPRKKSNNQSKRKWNKQEKDIYHHAITNNVRRAIERNQKPLVDQKDASAHRLHVQNEKTLELHGPVHVRTMQDVYMATPTEEIQIRMASAIVSGDIHTKKVADFIADAYEEDPVLLHQTSDDRYEDSRLYAFIHKKAVVFERTFTLKKGLGGECYSLDTRRAHRHLCNGFFGDSGDKIGVTEHQQTIKTANSFQKGERLVVFFSENPADVDRLLSDEGMSQNQDGTVKQLKWQRIPQNDQPDLHDKLTIAESVIVGKNFVDICRTLNVPINDVWLSNKMGSKLVHRRAYSEKNPRETLHDNSQELNILDYTTSCWDHSANKERIIDCQSSPSRSKPAATAHSIDSSRKRSISSPSSSRASDESKYHFALSRISCSPLESDQGGVQSLVDSATSKETAPELQIVRVSMMQNDPSVVDATFESAHTKESLDMHLSTTAFFRTPSALFFSSPVLQATCHEPSCQPHQLHSTEPESGCDASSATATTKQQVPTRFLDFSTTPELSGNGLPDSSSNSSTNAPRFEQLSSSSLGLSNLILDNVSNLPLHSTPVSGYDAPNLESALRRHSNPPAPNGQSTQPQQLSPIQSPTEQPGPNIVSENNLSDGIHAPSTGTKVMNKSSEVVPPDNWSKDTSNIFVEPNSKRPQIAQPLVGPKETIEKMVEEAVQNKEPLPTMLPISTQIEVAPLENQIIHTGHVTPKRSEWIEKITSVTMTTLINGQEWEMKSHYSILHPKNTYPEIFPLALKIDDKTYWKQDEKEVAKKTNYGPAETLDSAFLRRGSEDCIPSQLLVNPEQIEMELGKPVSLEVKNDEEKPILVRVKGPADTIQIVPSELVLSGKALSVFMITFNKESPAEGELAVEWIGVKAGHLKGESISKMVTQWIDEENGIIAKKQIPFKLHKEE
ncbi:unnamed protein product, partial [Mesorhabditis belari]|uniref:Uncharacterized protein n=1 Tax=Mesorhabditis belari TaxID=2138241 RepID=A0AAF3J5L2_9BILA